MANWLLDYIEMTEYIPIEFRDQSFLMRELDLKVSNKMSQLEAEIKDFFTNIDKLDLTGRQDQYNALLKKCDEAAQAASDKIKLADKLHDLVEKSMRILDQGLEKLKEDLIEGDKGYIVEDIEKRSQEVDQQLRAGEESMISRQQHCKSTRDPRPTNSKNTVSNNLNNHHHSNHRHSLPANHHQSHHHHSSRATNHVPHHRSRNHSTGTQPSVPGEKPRKRERKRLNSTMTIFNRNSATKTDDDSTNQTFLSSPSTPDYLIGLQNSNSNSLNDISGGDNSSLALKGIISGNRITNAGTIDKINGNDPILAKARQPILTAIDAAHAVSPNATNSDKLVLFSGHANGDNHINETQSRQIVASVKVHNHSDKKQQSSLSYDQLSSQLSSHLISNSTNHGMGYDSAEASNQMGSSAISSRCSTDKKNFNTLPLSSRHDPIMIAASQAIQATQSMTSGRRTSSLKASYAAVNSGRMRPSPVSNQSAFDQSAMTGEVYCKCRRTYGDPNMIACDNKNCEIEWFHYECVGITTPPEGEWFCDDCRASMGLKSSNSQQSKNSLDTQSALPSSVVTAINSSVTQKIDTEAIL